MGVAPHTAFERPRFEGWVLTSLNGQVRLGSLPSVKLLPTKDKGSVVGGLSKAPESAAIGWVRQLLLKPTFGPLIVLLVFCAIFSLTTRTFFAAGNLSL